MQSYLKKIKNISFVFIRLSRIPLHALRMNTEKKLLRWMSLNGHAVSTQADNPPKPVRAITSYIKGRRRIHIGTTAMPVVLFSIVIAAPVFVFAQESSLIPKGNKGIIESSQSPETKKAAKESKQDAKKEQKELESLTQLQLEARAYRDQGLKYQQIGNIDAALGFYQKAIELDSLFAVAYNDLGVIYETKGETDRAEESYLSAIKIDPSYLSACTNLALFYENKRDFNKAAIYWGKRAALGSPEDPWTEKAKKRLEDIQFVSSRTPLRDSREHEVVEFLKEVANKKALLKNDDKALAREHFSKSKKSYDKQDYPTAIKEALDAQQLDPDNPEIQNFIDKAQVRALTR